MVLFEDIKKPSAFGLAEGLLIIHYRGVYLFEILYFKTAFLMVVGQNFLLYGYLLLCRRNKKG